MRAAKAIALGLLGGGAFDYYVSNSGSDSFTGRSSATPFATLAAAVAAIGAATGKRIGLATGSTWFEQMSLTTNNTTVGAYGSGAAPYIDCRDAVLVGAWSKTAGRTNVYQATITLPNNVKSLGNVWFDEAFAVQKTSIALVDATAGTAYVSDWTAASATLYVNLADSSNPGLGVVTVRYSRRLYAITGTGNNCTVRGIKARGNGHQDGSIALYGTGNIIDSCRLEDGARHNALLGGGALCLNTYFYQARNDLESGACSMLVINQSDLSASSYSTSGCTFDANNVTGQTISGFDAHDSVSNRKAVSCTHTNPTIMNGCLFTNDNATTQVINNPVLSNAGTFLAPGNSGSTVTINNISGSLAGTARLLNNSTGDGTFNFVGGSLTVAQVGSGVINSSNTGADCNVSLTNMTFSCTALGASVFEFARISRGTYTRNGCTFGPVMAFPMGLVMEHVGISATGSILGNNNTFPFGYSNTLNGSASTTLAAWQAGGQDAASIYGSPTVTFTDTFARADENLEASANWTRVDGVAGAFAVKSNQAAAIGATATAYQAPTVSSNDMYARGNVASTSVSLDFCPAVRVTDKSNCAGGTWTTTQYKFWTEIAGAFSQKAVVTQAPVVGDDFAVAVRGAFCYGYVNKQQIFGPSATADTALTSVRAGLVNTGTAANPAIDNFTCGPA